MSECTCPVLSGGRRGFRMRCPVHGGQSREDFVRSTEARAELFRGLRTPASVLGYFKKREKDS